MANKTDKLIAWRGEVEFAGAFSDDIWGRYVKFRVPQSPGDQGKANPFKTFTKARSGRVGTRFEAAIQGVGVGPIQQFEYHGEVMLKGWSDSSAGWGVQFVLELEKDFHPFMGQRRPDKEAPGSRFMVALVELDDDDTPIDQEKRERLKRAHKRGKTPQTLSNVAAMMIKHPRFGDWLSETVDDSRQWTDAERDAWVKQYLGILTKRELDVESTAQNVDTIRNFHNSIRLPFNNWLGDQGIA